MAAHSGLTADADLHICKGVLAAAVGKTVIADGAGSQALKYANPHGGFSFSDIATPATVTAPSSYTKVAPTTVAAGGAIEYTEATTARLTYTGTDTLDANVFISLCIGHAAGANRDIYVSLYKNGSAVTGTETAVTAVTATKTPIPLSFQIANVATNDYFEVYLKNNGGAENVSVYSFQMSMVSYRG